MGFINKTPSGSYRANWRDPAGRQCSKTFPTKRDASAYLAEITATLNRGTYVNPAAGKTKFGPYATAWLEGRNNERTTVARDRSIVTTHVIPRWGGTPFGRVDHSAVQTWITGLSEHYSPATVAKILQLTSAIFQAAIRDRLITVNPCEGVKLPAQRWTDSSMRVITREQFTTLLEVIPDRYRALIAMGAGTGLRWGELVALRLDAIDRDQGLLRVIRTLTEVAGHVTVKPYPKSRAGRRIVPIPAFALAELDRHVKAYPTAADGQIFTNTAGGPLRRTLFRSRVWRPALVRAGLLGDVTRTDAGTWRGMWEDSTDTTRYGEFATEREAVAYVAKHCAGPCPRFHDLRHSFATWLVSDGVPINDVSKVMGHEQTSTTLNRYTHPSPAYVNRVRDVFADFPLTRTDEKGPETNQATDDPAA